jgi:uridine kinase
VLRVAIDGIDGAGKSTFADELATVLREDEVPVIRSTTDSFHHPRSIRLARGLLSAEGFYRDSHDLAQLQALLLDPLSTDPPRAYRVAAFDEPTDSPVNAPLETAAGGAVLLFDGLFLQRPELRPYWDLVVWVDGAQRVADERIRRIGAAIPPGPSGIVALARSCAVLGRYLHGMQLYLDECSPLERATVIVRNDDLAEPSVEQLREAE